MTDEKLREAIAIEPFGPRLRRLMDRAGLSVIGLAKKAGVSVESLEHFMAPEGRLIDVDAEEVVDIARALDISTDELLGVESPAVKRLREALDAGRDGVLWDLDEASRVFLRSLLPESERG